MIEDQAQEIEVSIRFFRTRRLQFTLIFILQFSIQYLTKQTAALKEVNTSRIKIYEQLEVSIQDLEHANLSLSHQSVSDKKQIKG